MLFIEGTEINAIINRSFLVVSNGDFDFSSSSLLAMSYLLSSSSVASGDDGGSSEAVWCFP